MLLTQYQLGIFFFKMQFCFLILFPITVIINVMQTVYETGPKYIHKVTEQWILMAWVLLYQGISSHSAEYSPNAFSVVYSLISQILYIYYKISYLYH